jgi:Lon protease-like protein
MADNTIELPGRLPVMVLPGALLFPHALLPLYIFEQRYRDMLAHCLAGDRMFCVALMKPGIAEAVAGPAQFFQVAGCGLVRACVGREDGTSNLILQGLRRVRFTGFAQETPFRIAEIQEIVSEAGNPVETDALGAKVLELCQRLKERGLQLPGQLDTFLSHLTNLDMLADLVAHTFISDPFQRQELLEEPLIPARLRLLIKFLAAELK